MCASAFGNLEARRRNRDTCVSDSAAPTHHTRQDCARAKQTTAKVAVSATKGQVNDRRSLSAPNVTVQLLGAHGERQHPSPSVFGCLLVVGGRVGLRPTMRCGIDFDFGGDTGLRDRILWSANITSAR